MMESTLFTLLRMRLIVGFLGERAQFAWWPTAFYEASSRLFLEPVFSNNYRLAQYHGVVEAARRLHDEYLSGSYHLFRLTEEIEQDLHAFMQSSDGARLAGKLPGSQDTALEALKSLSQKPTKASEGPSLVGSVKDVNTPDSLDRIAGAYFSAFSLKTRVYPYLTGPS